MMNGDGLSYLFAFTCPFFLSGHKLVECLVLSRVFLQSVRSYNSYVCHDRQQWIPIVHVRGIRPTPCIHCLSLAFNIRYLTDLIILTELPRVERGLSLR